MSSPFDATKYIAWLSSPDPYHRGTAVAVLWHAAIRNKEIEEKIQHILKTDDQISIRRDAVKMISDWRDKKFFEILVGLLNDEDWQVRGEALLAIKKIDPDLIIKDSRIKEYCDTDLHPFARFCIEYQTEK